MSSTEKAIVVVVVVVSAGSIAVGDEPLSLGNNPGSLVMGLDGCNG